MDDFLNAIRVLGTTIAEFLGLRNSLTRRLCLLVLDRNRVLRFDANGGGFLDTFVGRQTQFLSPRQNMRFGADGHLLIPAASPDWKPIGLVRFNGTTGSLLDVFAPWPPSTGNPHRNPAALAVAPDGDVYAGAIGTNANPQTLYRFNGKTGALLGATPLFPGTFYAGTMTIGPDGHVYVRNCVFGEPNLGGKILRYDGKTGAFISVFVELDLGQLDTAGGMAFGPDGNLYVSNYTYGSILRYHGTTGALIDTFVPRETLNRPRGLTFGPDGDLYVASLGGSPGQPAYGHVTRIHGQSGEVVQTYIRLGADLMYPTDVLVKTMEVRPPALSGLLLGPRAVWMAGAVLLGAALGRALLPHARR